MANYYSAGADLTAALLNASPVGYAQCVRKTTDHTRNANASLNADPELVVAVLASTVWSVETCLIYSAATAADVRFGLAVPSGSSGNLTSFGLQLAATTSIDTVDCSAPGVGNSVFAGGRGAGSLNKLMSPLRGVVIVSTTAGNVTLQFGQSTSNASDAVLYAGSWMKLTRLA